MPLSTRVGVIEPTVGDTAVAKQAESGKQNKSGEKAFGEIRSTC